MKNTHLRFTEEFRRKFDLDQISRKDFMAWARRQGKGFGIAKWRPMKDGEFVPRDMIEFLLFYIGDVLQLGSFKVKDVAVLGDGIATPAWGRRLPVENAWTRGWPWLMQEITRPVSIDPLAYCGGDDMLPAAEMIMESHGVNEGGCKSKVDAIAFSEKRMKRTASQYADLLRKSWEANEHSVLFTVADVKGRPVRTGINVVMAFAEDFYRRMRAGKAEDIDATVDDLPERSLFLHVNAALDDPGIQKTRGKSGRSFLQRLTLATQTAALAPPFRTCEFRPRSLCLAGSKDGRKKLEDSKYKYLGVMTPRTQMELMELAPPPAEAANHEFAEYGVIISLLIFLQGTLELREKAFD